MAVPPVSRDVLRAVLEVRDSRHNETHAALLGLIQALMAELVDAGAIRVEPLAERLDTVHDNVVEDVHGAAARDLVRHVAGWLRTVSPDLPSPEPEHWQAPPVHEDMTRHTGPN
jgi:hypothetical protein